MATLFSLTPDNRLATDEEILADLRRVAALVKPSDFTGRRYGRAGHFSLGMVCGRFGRWNRALTEAGLAVCRRRGMADEEYFLEMEKVWRALGRRPTIGAFDLQKTRICAGSFAYRFGSWRAAMRRFINWANSAAADLPGLGSPTVLVAHPRAHPLQPGRTPRSPSMTLRHEILKRDHFKCVQCGRSPATEANVVLQVDHILAWSKGGRTIAENLQTLCRECNGGKSDSM
jgi:hypothetical protein